MFKARHEVTDFWTIRHETWIEYNVHVSSQYPVIIWASTRENLSSGVCGQHRRRPACASAQSDQRLRYSRFVKYHTKACYKRNFIFLASLCSWAGWFESLFVGNPEDRFSRDEAQTYSKSGSPSVHQRNAIEWRLAGGLMVVQPRVCWQGSIDLCLVRLSICRKYPVARDHEQ